MSKKVICKNDRNVEVQFDYQESPFHIVSIDGIYSISNNVNVSENTMNDGSTYLGSTTKQRNIVITASIFDHYIENRNLLYKCFIKNSKGTFTYIEENEIREINYIVESLAIDDVGVVKNTTISLICTDPFFTDIEDVVVNMSGWKGNFEFGHEFKEEKEGIGIRISEQLKVIDNESSVDNIGIEIYIEALSIVTNPSIYHVELGEIMSFGTSGVPFVLKTGEIIKIVTRKNEKSVVKITEEGETNIIRKMSEESEFIQLMSGINTLRYDAGIGKEDINVKICYKRKYMGV